MVNLKIGYVKDSLQIFFWLVCIESIFKVSTAYTKEKEVEGVNEFFSIYLEQKDQEKLVENISKDVRAFQYVNIELVANMFNTVRNTVAHEGIYWMFTFPTKKGDSLINVIPKEKTSFFSTYTMGEENLDTYTISIIKEEVRTMIVRGSLNYLENVITILMGRNHIKLCFLVIILN